MKYSVMRWSMVVVSTGLLLLLSFESVCAEPSKETSLQKLRDSPLVMALSLRNTGQKYAGIISGECTKYTADNRTSRFDKDAKQLECRLVQNRFVPSKDGFYDLFVDVFQQTFRRSSETGQWVSRNGPDGMCGTVDVTTLEVNPNSPDTVMTYSSLQIHTNRTGSVCEHLPKEEREAFSRTNPLTTAPLTLRNSKINHMFVAFRSTLENSQKTKGEQSNEQ